MKKALGILAVAGAAVAYAAYKLGKEEPTEEEKIIHEPQSEEEITETILKNVEANNEETEEETEDIEIIELNDEKKSIKEKFVNLNDDDIKHIEEISTKELEKINDADGERPIQHVVYFANDLDKEEFKNNVISKGYVVTNGENDDLIVMHISKLDKETILSQVYYLADLTKLNNGEYKEWSIK